MSKKTPSQRRKHKKKNERRRRIRANGYPQGVIWEPWMLEEEYDPGTHDYELLFVDGFAPCGEGSCPIV